MKYKIKKIEDIFFLSLSFRLVPSQLGLAKSYKAGIVNGYDVT